MQYLCYPFSLTHRLCDLQAVEEVKVVGVVVAAEAQGGKVVDLVQVHLLFP
jgi:hypothetical protein